ncbi:uncharacterized protein EMH_0079020 [Eimeria mitis]|uniref:Uncharacterized protein n=1 Tax=Eimeria mitis TaxID=44415 RepID=U6JSK1_9EIME|nr:uncharacterized protein EMH_0079020 [Eimeria mitis]CDJ27042.1 hypothetical protein, conserved [Eimeria mitis]
MLATTEAGLAVADDENRWLSTGTLTMAEPADSHGIFNAGTSLDALDGHIEHQSTAELRPISSSATPDVPCPKPERRLVRISSLTKGLGAFLTLSLCVWFLSAGKKPRPVSSEGASEPSDDITGKGFSTQSGSLAITPLVGSQSEELRRLQRVQMLLPSASRLAAAIGTPEAQKLLGSAQKASTEARLAAKSVLDGKRLTVSLNSAVDALRSLHQVALQQAKALVQDGADIPVFSLIESEEVEDSVKNEVDHVIEGQSVLPYMVYLRTVQESVIDISRRFEDARKRLLAETEFSDERDEQMLVSAATELEWLLSLSERKRQAVRRATTLKGCAISGVRVHLKCLVEEWTRTIQGNAELLHAYVDLVSSGIEASFEDYSPADLAVEDTSTVCTLRRKLAKVKELLSEMRRAKEAVHTSQSVGSSVAAFKRAEQLQGEAKDLLDDCWETTKLLPPPKSELSPSDVAVLGRTAKKLQIVTEEHNAAVGDSLSVVYRRCSDALQKGSTGEESAKYINPSVAEQLRAEALATEGKLALHYQEVQEAVAKLQNAGELTDALILLEDLEGHIPVFVECNKRAVLLVLETYLQTLLEEDIRASVKTAARTFSSKLILTGPNRMHFEKLRGRFNKAKTAVNKATTLTEAAQAAAKVRMHADALSDFASIQWRGRLEPP